MRGKALLLFALLGSAVAQTAVKSTHAHEGCVTATPDDASSFVLAEGDACYLLRGKLASARLANHQVRLHGPDTPATDEAPITIDIQGIDHVGASCQATCTLEPPGGGRGFHRRPKPGAPGGTPGM